MRRLAAGLGFHRVHSRRCQSRQGDERDLGEVDLLEQATGFRPHALHGPETNGQAVKRAFFEQCVSLAPAHGVEDEPAFDGEPMSGFANIKPAADRGAQIVRPKQEGHPTGTLVLGQRFLERARRDGIAEHVDLAEHAGDAFERARLVGRARLQLKVQPAKLVLGLPLALADGSALILIGELGHHRLVAHAARQKCIVRLAMLRQGQGHRPAPRPRASC
jgi:hypothetical protein